MDDNPRFWKILDRLRHRFYEFDVFQAVRILEVACAKDGVAPRVVGDGLKLSADPIRFRAHVSLSFPPSSIAGLDRVPPITLGDGAGAASPVWEGPVVMTQAFLGVIGPSGVLPRHYTDMVVRMLRYDRGPNREALRDFLDMFHHRLTTLFYRAWRKHHYPMAFERYEFLKADPDPFTRALLASSGMATAGLRHRLRLFLIPSTPGGTGEGVGGEDQDPYHDSSGFPAYRSGRAENAVYAEPALTMGLSAPVVRAEIEDLVFLRYAGLFLHHPRTAIGLQNLLSSYFRIPVNVIQFVGQWLRLSPEDQSRLPEDSLGALGQHHRLGRDVFAGQKVWDTQSKIRICLGPLDWTTFRQFLPDPSLANRLCGYFLLGQLARFYVGADIDFDVQLVLRREAVPACRLPSAALGLVDGDHPPRLGWETWAVSRQPQQDCDDAVFPLDAIFTLNEERIGESVTAP